MSHKELICMADDFMLQLVWLAVNTPSNRVDDLCHAVMDAIDKLIAELQEQEDQ